VEYFTYNELLIMRKIYPINYVIQYCNQPFVGP
jgi:hypothetical protein